MVFIRLFYFESIFLTLLNLVGSLKIMLFSSKFWLGQKSHSPKTVFWLLTQFQLSNFSSYFSELGGSIVLTDHNFDTFFLWEIFFQWFWHFRLENRYNYFFIKVYGPRKNALPLFCLTSTRFSSFPTLKNALYGLLLILTLLFDSLFSNEVIFKFFKILSHNLEYFYFRTKFLTEKGVESVIVLDH